MYLFLPEHSVQTDLAIPVSVLPTGTGAPVEQRRQGTGENEKSQLEPVQIHRNPGTEIRQSARVITQQGIAVAYEPPKPRIDSRPDIRAVPIEVWEGVVKQIDEDRGVMIVTLDSKLSNMPRHTAEIELEWVTEQDHDLLKLGAVFYLTLFKRTRPSIENAQELRFRRRPAWTKQQLERVRTDAKMIRARGKARPPVQ